jgi:hypothetical protein
MQGLLPYSELARLAEARCFLCARSLSARSEPWGTGICSGRCGVFVWSVAQFVERRFARARRDGAAEAASAAA